MFHVYWPAIACLTLVLIVGVIIFILKYGDRACKRFGGRALPSGKEEEY